MTRSRILRPSNQITKPALEGDRARYQLRMLEYSASDLVFGDESGVNYDTFMRTFGRAPVGERAERSDYFARGIKCVILLFVLILKFNMEPRYSILPALAIDGIIDVSIVQGAHNSETFFNFVDGLLDKMNPYPNQFWYLTIFLSIMGMIL